MRIGIIIIAVLCNPLQHNNYNKYEPFSTHEMVPQLVPALLHLKVTIETTKVLLNNSYSVTKNTTVYKLRQQLQFTLVPKLRVACSELE